MPQTDSIATTNHGNFVNPQNAFNAVWQTVTQGNPVSPQPSVNFIAAPDRAEHAQETLRTTTSQDIKEIPLISKKESPLFTVETLATQKTEPTHDTLETTFKVNEESCLKEHPLPYSLASDPFITVILVFLFASFCYTVGSKQKMIRETIKDFFYLKERSSIFVDMEVGRKGTFWFILLFVGGVSFFMNELFFFYKPESNLTALNLYPEIKYLGLFVLLSIIYITVKYLVFRFLGYVFFDKHVSTLFMRTYFTILLGYGLILFPIAVCLVYFPPRAYYSLIIIGLLLSLTPLLLIFYKTIQIFRSGIVSVLYIILYLCSLEILPILVVLKFLS